MKRVLAVDLGGSSGRGIVYSYDGNVLNGTEVHRFENGAHDENGTLRWDLPYLFQEVKTALKKVFQMGLSVESLSIDTWGVDYAYVDTQGNIVENPFSYRDSRTDGMTEVFPPLNNRALYELSGISLTSFNTSYQLYADAKSRDFSKVKTLLFMPNAIGYLLTGIAATEPCIASTSAFYKKESGFSKEFCSLINAPFRIMPKVQPTGSILGEIKAEILAELGIFQSVKVVLGAGHDTACAVMSVPTDEPNPLFLSSGTWSLFGAELDNPVVSDESFQENYTNELGYGNTVRFLKNIMGFWLLQECRKAWSEEKKISADEVAALSRTAPAFQGFIDVGDQAFNAPGDMPNRIKVAVLKNYNIELNTIAEIARAMFESLALEYRYALDGLMKITGKNYQSLYIVGGGSRNDFMNQMTADCLGLTVYAGPSEATAIGNAVGQLIALGALPNLKIARSMIKRAEKVKVFTPTPNRTAWDSAYQKYLQLKTKKDGI